MSTDAKYQLLCQNLAEAMLAEVDANTNVEQLRREYATGPFDLSAVVALQRGRHTQMSRSADTQSALQELHDYLQRGGARL